MLGNLVSKYPRSGFLPGALMGGAGLIGAGLVSATGAGKYVAGATAIGAGAKRGADWLGSKSFGGNKSPADKEDTSEELSKVSSIGLLSVDKLDAIYNNVVDIKKFFADQDPESQAREAALDEQVKKKQLIKAISGIGGGSGGGIRDSVKGGLLGLFKDIFGIAALTALFTNLDKVEELFDKLPGWADNIQEAIDNIMEFVNDLDGFFKGLGIEFGGFAGRGALRGLNRATKIYKNRRGPNRTTSRSRVEQIKKNKADRIARDKEAKRLKKLKEKFAKQKLKQERLLKDSKASQEKIAKAKAQTEKLNKQMEVERENLRNRRAANAKAMAAEEAKQQARRDKRAARNQRFREAAAKAKAKIFNIPDDAKSTVKPNPQAKSNTPFLRNKGDPMPKTAQGPKVKYSPSAFLLGKGPQGNIVPGSGTRPSSITGSSIGDNVKSKMAPNPKATIIPKSRPMGPSASAYGEGYDRVWGNKTTPKAFNIADVKSTTPPNKTGGFKPSSVGPSNRGKPGVIARASGGVKSLVEAFKKAAPVIKDTITKPKFKNIPAAAVAAFENTDDAGKPGIWEKLKKADDWLGRNQWSIRILKGIGWSMMGLLAAMDMYNLITNWTDNKTDGDMNPFDSTSPADKAFTDGLIRLAGEYGGGYFGAVAGGMIGSMVPLPFVGTIVGALAGGVAGALIGGELADLMNESVQWSAKPKQLAQDVNQLDDQMDNIKASMLGANNSGMSAMNPIAAANMQATLDALEKEKTKKLEEAGSLDEEGKVIFINNYTDASNHALSQRSSSVSTTINPHDGFVPYEKKKGPTMQGRF